MMPQRNNSGINSVAYAFNVVTHDRWYITDAIAVDPDALAWRSNPQEC